MKARRRNAPREPMFWDRTRLALSWSGAGPSGLALFQPDIFTSANTDSSYTLKRLKLNINATLFVAIGTGSATHLEIGYGIYMADKNSLLRDPLLGTTDDQQADWLALWSDIVEVPPTPPATVLGINSAQRQEVMIDVKAQRRVNELQTVILAINGATMGGTFPASFSWNSQMVCSNLTSRSLRR